MTKTTMGDRPFATASDQQLLDGVFNALGDLALAERYEHNADKVPQIQRHIDALHRELQTRGLPLPHD